MTISEELSYAILSLDAYNRGYAPGIPVDGDGPGWNTILTDSERIFCLPGQDPNTLSPAGVASFYAAAYQDASDNIVISYRGTVDPLGGDLAVWTGGAGFQTRQAELAAEFYYQVKQAYPTATITLTGHSLGGALCRPTAPPTVGCATAHHPL